MEEAAARRRDRATMDAAWLVVTTAIDRLDESWEAVASMVDATEAAEDERHPAWTVAAELLEEASSVLFAFFERLNAGADDGEPEHGGPEHGAPEGAEVVPLRPHLLAPSEEAMAAAATMEDVVLVASDLTDNERSIVVRRALAALGVAQVPDVPEDSLPAFMRMLLRGPRVGRPHLEPPLPARITRPARRW